MFNQPTKLLTKFIALFFLLLGSYIYLPKHSGEAISKGKLNRNQVMLLNLKSAPMSAGYYIVTSHRTSKAIIQDLEQALNQVTAVDQAYAKYRHRPDDRFMQSTCLKITLARQTAQELEEQLKDAFAELKSNIEETLISDEHFPDKK
jgi:predicted TIM-barrel fold metal-dependent hydrolase